MVLTERLGFHRTSEVSGRRGVEREGQSSREPVMTTP